MGEDEETVDTHTEKLGSEDFVLDGAAAETQSPETQRIYYHTQWS